MRNVTIPEEDIGGFVSLFSLTNEEFINLESILKELEPSPSPLDIIDRITTQLKHENNEAIANFTAKLFISLVLNDDSEDRFSEAFHLIYTQNEKESSITKEAFQDRFNRLINIVKPTKQAQRISQIKQGSGLYLRDQKIQMHIKPVFSNDTGDLIGNVFTHQLQLEVESQDEEEETLSIEIDKQDMIKLKEMFETSIKQQEILEDKFKEMNIHILDV